MKCHKISNNNFYNDKVETVHNDSIMKFTKMGQVLFCSEVAM